MTLSVIWTVLAAVSVLFGAATGRASEVGTAAMQGAGAAVELCLGIGGMLCLWSGVMELMRRAGILAGLSKMLHPLLSRLFPVAAGDEETMGWLSTNVAANLLGLGNAATPAGIKAAQGINRLSGDNGELSRLVVLNTASVQLLPTTVAAIRAAAGCESPFDILPAVWLSSICSVTVGLIVSRLLEMAGRRGGTQ